MQEKLNKIAFIPDIFWHQCCQQFYTTLLQHFSATLLYNPLLQTLLQHFWTALLYNTSLQHFNTLLQHFFTTLFFNTLPQHFSTTVFFSTSSRHIASLLSSPTLLYNFTTLFYTTLLQHPSFFELSCARHYNSGSHWAVLGLSLLDNGIKRKGQGRWKTKHMGKKKPFLQFLPHRF